MTGTLEGLSTMVLLGLPGAALAMIVRTLPWPASWKKKKPLICPTCLGSHSTLAVLLMSWANGWMPYLHGATLNTACAVFLLWLGGSAVAVWLVSQTTVFSQPLEDLLPPL